MENYIEETNKEHNGLVCFKFIFYVLICISENKHLDTQETLKNSIHGLNAQYSLWFKFLFRISTSTLVLFCLVTYWIKSKDTCWNLLTINLFSVQKLRRGQNLGTRIRCAIIFLYNIFIEIFKIVDVFLLVLHTLISVY